MNKQVNQYLKNLKKCLNGNKVCLNIIKTEYILFKSSKEKHTDVPLKLKLKGIEGKKLYPNNSVKYLGVKIDANFTWKQ